MRGWLCVVTLVLVASTAEAAPPKSQSEIKRAAGQLLTEGNQLFERGDFQAALSRYQAAYQTYPSPKIFLNLAKAHEALGQLVLAAEQFERFIKAAGVNQTSTLYQEAKAGLALVDARLGRIALEGEVLGAEVFLDGKPVGKLPLEPVRAQAGTHEVVCQKPGYQALTKQFVLESSKTVMLDLTLKMKTAPPPPVVVTPVPEPEEDSIVTKWWFWAAIVGVAAATTVGVAVASGGEAYRPDTELGVSNSDQWEKL